MTDLKVRLLGQFSVSLENTPSTSFASDKVRALFAYLITEVHCPHRREVLANLLWSDQPEETSRANLRRALSNLRKCIQDHDAIPPYLLIMQVWGFQNLDQAEVFAKSLKEKPSVIGEKKCFINISTTSVISYIISYI